MKIFGYNKDNDELQNLKEVSILCDSYELNEIINYLKYVRTQMTNHEDHFGHEHFSDWLAKRGDESNIDIIVVGSQLVNK
ncbi:hypothetical protein WH95_09395 [Kiloniella litopenaei]|uniref:Uncharacterized protein n=1 Tax=Kiloniella litopenaei TaxID=1549748 RepID=A0A0M2R6G0_9PROT|nr:hypothetical protein [Kiloniella litopenaei]KKJ77241.1 hypothetical protein WH95_09395 [Kiloniella litopenaei]